MKTANADILYFETGPHNLLVALGWGDAGKWTGFGIVLFVLLIVYVSNRRRR